MQLIGAVRPICRAPFRQSDPRRRFGGATERARERAREKRETSGGLISGEARRRATEARGRAEERARAAGLAAARIARASSAAQQPSERRSLPTLGDIKFYTVYVTADVDPSTEREGNGAFRLARPPHSAPLRHTARSALSTTTYRHSSPPLPQAPFPSASNHDLDDKRSMTVSVAPTTRRQ
uniref:Uncharacterized protein n=1 Tax=Plectus sambesii TaxID=2011161 RepID=A0A914VNQ9_9BILA